MNKLNTIANDYSWLKAEEYSFLKIYIDKRIAIEKVFSRLCGVKPNNHGKSIEDVRSEYERVYKKEIKFKLISYKNHDPSSHYQSIEIAYKILQKGPNVKSDYAKPKTNTFYLCPFCEFKPPSPGKEHKPHNVISITKDEKEVIVDSKVEGFYDTGQSAISHHLANCHGVLKKSLMPQPFVGFSKSLCEDNVYKPALVCPHQHWDDKGQLVGCNSVFPYQLDDDIPFKAYFRHFYEYHVSVPKTEAQKQAYAKKLENLDKEPKHIQSPDNEFIQLDQRALSETIHYQKKNTKDDVWYGTLKTIEINKMAQIQSLCIKNHEDYRPPTEKDEALITHDAVTRKRGGSITSSDGGSPGSSKKYLKEVPPESEADTNSMQQQVHRSQTLNKVQANQRPRPQSSNKSALKSAPINKVHKPKHSNSKDIVLSQAQQQQVADDLEWFESLPSFTVDTAGDGATNMHQNDLSSNNHIDPLLIDSSEQTQMTFTAPDVPNLSSILDENSLNLDFEQDVDPLSDSFQQDMDHLMQDYPVNGIEGNNAMNGEMDNNGETIMAPALSDGNTNGDSSDEENGQASGGAESPVSNTDGSNDLQMIPEIPQENGMGENTQNAVAESPVIRDDFSEDGKTPPYFGLNGFSDDSGFYYELEEEDDNWIGFLYD